LSGVARRDYSQVETTTSITQPSARSWEGSLQDSRSSLPVSHDEHSVLVGKKSAAPTVSTNPETTHSDTAQSKAGTANTATGAQSTHGLGGEGSTFSSPAPSLRSLTTTLTTIHSAHLNALTGANQATQSSAPQTTHFSHQFPTTNPASALPSHMVQHSGGYPATYMTATANNLLTDNASILTLASSSKRRRRNSLDTNASIRALAPSSIFGGSRESLPLSVLSGPVPDASNTQASSLAAVHSRPSIGGIPAAERASVYSSSGIAANAALSSERNSYYANPKQMGDGASMRSGRVSHGRNDSITGSIAGVTASSPLASPLVHERLSRRNSGWEESEELAEDASPTNAVADGGKPGSP
jgi:hypothetical protein